MKALGCSTDEIDIRPSCMQMLKDIGHPYREGQQVYDVTFENVQAGERTSHLFRLANLHGGLVVGTGDLSELALGWCTYGVGDHMSHYSVNASVPKTLIQHVIRWVAQPRASARDAARRCSTSSRHRDQPRAGSRTCGRRASQPDTEATIGPYELHDFFLYYTLRFGYPPSKVAFLAYNAWHDAEAGEWPDIPADRRNQYDIATSSDTCARSCTASSRLSQFKRSAIPNAPKVGSGGSLSPRGDWRAPSDSEASAWLEQLKSVPDKD